MMQIEWSTESEETTPPAAGAVLGISEMKTSVQLTFVRASGTHVDVRRSG